HYLNAVREALQAQCDRSSRPWAAAESQEARRAAQLIRLQARPASWWARVARLLALLTAWLLGSRPPSRLSTGACARRSPPPPGATERSPSNTSAASSTGCWAGQGSLGSWTA